jgi:hypothetical protein
VLPNAVAAAKVTSKHAIIKPLISNFIPILLCFSISTRHNCHAYVTCLFTLICRAELRNLTTVYIAPF